jgi:predicted DsbA family dithiol-disulfide isomerase
MKITIWSDFVCPFCFIGQSHLDQALKHFEQANNVEIEYKSFLLMPDAKYVSGKSYAETFAELKGLSLQQAETMLNQVVNMGKQAGIEINYDIAKLSSTVDAHRVFQFAKKLGKGTAFFKRFYRAHFSEGELLSDHDTIVRLAREIGLTEVDVRNVLDDKDPSNEMMQDIYEAQSVGVQGVPFFVFNNKYAVSGAQPVDTFVQVLTKVWKEEQEKN